MPRATPAVARDCTVVGEERVQRASQTLQTIVTTGALQTAAVVKLLDGETNKVGFASGSKAFGHRYLLGYLEQRGLARASISQL